MNVTRISPLRVLVNENGPCARGRGPLITDTRSARAGQTSARVILSACATQAVENGPLLEKNVRTRNGREQNSFMSHSKSNRSAYITVEKVRLLERKRSTRGGQRSV